MEPLASKGCQVKSRQAVTTPAQFRRDRHTQLTWRSVMTNLKLILKPWSKPETREEAQYLSAAGAVIVAALAVLWAGELWSNAESFEQIAKQIGLLSGTTVPKHVFLAVISLSGPILDLYLAAGIFLGYRGAAVIYVLWVVVGAIVSTSLIAISPDALNASDYLSLLQSAVECLAASAALRGTFRLNKFGPLHKKEGTPNQPAKLRTSEVPLQPSRSSGMRVAALKAAAGCVSMVGIVIAVVSLLFVSSVIGWVFDASAGAKLDPLELHALSMPNWDHLFTPTGKVLFLLWLGFLCLLCGLAGSPFFAVARGLWSKALLAEQTLAVERWSRRQAQAGDADNTGGGRNEDAKAA
jgi:hypothetical protein